MTPAIPRKRIIKDKGPVKGVLELFHNKQVLRIYLDGHPRRKVERMALTQREAEALLDSLIKSEFTESRFRK